MRNGSTSCRWRWWAYRWPRPSIRSSVVMPPLAAADVRPPIWGEPCVWFALPALPAHAGLILLGGPLVEMLFEHGAFTADDRRTTHTIIAYGLGIAAYCALPVVRARFMPWAMPARRYGPAWSQWRLTPRSTVLGLAARRGRTRACHGAVGRRAIDAADRVVCPAAGSTRLAGACTRSRRHACRHGSPGAAAGRCVPLLPAHASPVDAVLAVRGDCTGRSRIPVHRLAARLRRVGPARPAADCGRAARMGRVCGERRISSTASRRAARRRRPRSGRGPGRPARW